MRNEILVISDVVELLLDGSSLLLVVLSELALQMLLARKWMHGEKSRLHYVIELCRMLYMLHDSNASNVIRA